MLFKLFYQPQDGTQIDASMEKLNAAWQAASEEIYKADDAGAQPGAEGQPEGAAAEGEPSSAEDVDFEEVTEEEVKK